MSASSLISHRLFVTALSHNERAANGARTVPVRSGFDETSGRKFATASVYGRAATGDRSRSGNSEDHRGIPPQFRAESARALITRRLLAATISNGVRLARV